MLHVCALWLLFPSLPPSPPPFYTLHSLSHTLALLGGLLTYQEVCPDVRPADLPQIVTLSEGRLGVKNTTPLIGRVGRLAIAKLSMFPSSSMP